MWPNDGFSASTYTICSGAISLRYVGIHFLFFEYRAGILALVPSVIKGYQMYTGYTPETLEIILWIMRIGLFVAIVWIGWKKREKIVLKELTFVIIIETIVSRYGFISGFNMRLFRDLSL